MLENDYVQITRTPYMPLTVEMIGEDIQTPWGIGKLYSLSHYYEQNGDLMRDPEMCFIMVDNRTEENSAFEEVKVLAYIYQQDNMGVYQESILIVDNSANEFKSILQTEHREYAELWLKGIEEKGFLNGERHYI